jgi:predicted permease
MNALLHDFRQAARSLIRAPGYTLFASLTLALGIGAATAVFSLIDGVLLRPLPYPDADRLVLIRQHNRTDEWNTSVADLQGITELGRSFEAVAASRSADVVMTGGGEPAWVSARWVTADYFRVMGIAPNRGRGFQAGEDRPGAERVVVVSQAFGEHHFGSGSDALGKTVTLDGNPYTVVGVMPPGADTLAAMRADVWPAMQLAEPERRGPFFLSTVARLKPGVTLEQASDDLGRVSREIFPKWQSGFGDPTASLVAYLLKDAIVGNARDALWVAFGAAFVLLAIALVNIANLILMRMTERTQELGVRAALGASRQGLARLLVVESFVLAVFGGAVGFGLAVLLLNAYRAIGPGLPRLAEVAVDARALAFCLVLALASGAIFGMVALFFASNQEQSALRKARGTSVGRTQQLLRGGLVAVEFALTVPLLVSAGLLIATLLRLQQVNPGFRADGLLTARLALLEGRHPDPAARMMFWDQALTELRTIPGVQDAGLMTPMVPSCGCYNNFDLLDRPVQQGSEPQTPWIPISSGLLEALGVPLLEGRTFNSGDTPDTPQVLLVTKSWAARYFPGESAVGKQLYEGGNHEQAVAIVGVVGDVKFDGLDRPGEAVFAYLNQGSSNNPVYVVLRSGADPLALAEPLRATLQRLDPALVPKEVTTMDSRLRDSMAGQRHWAVVIAGLAFSALLLAAVGIFGVLSYYVSRHVHEIGIRLAMGADDGRIVRLVLRRGITWVIAGTVCGILLAVVLGRSVESMLYGVAPTDPVTLAGVCALLLGIALAACWLPARRAARLDPLSALRTE